MNYILNKIRQWKYPKEFQISMDSMAEWNDIMMLILSQILINNQLEKKGDKTDFLKRINKEFLISLCNSYFRIKRNIEIIIKEGNARKEIRGIKRTLEKIEDTFEKMGLQYMDLTDEPYDPGRMDFEPLGEPEEIQGLSGEIILQCERPAVWFRGKLIQVAKGIVARPS